MRYDGGAHGADLLQRWRDGGRIVCCALKCAGGLPTPRPPAEIPAARAARCSTAACRVLTDDSADVTAAFVAGAESPCAWSSSTVLRVAVLKDAQPVLRQTHITTATSAAPWWPEGVTAALLKRHGVRVFNETQLAEAAAELAAWNKATTDPAPGAAAPKVKAGPSTHRSLPCVHCYCPWG